jgi:hypothetical protein
LLFLFDLLSFKFALGRYSIDAIRKRYPLNLSWEGVYEPVLEEILHEGDVVFLTNRHSLISWLIQYFTKTDISHCGVYVGNGNIFHATLSGNGVIPLRFFFDNGYNIMPVIFDNNVDDIKNTNKNIKYDDLLKLDYPIVSVIKRGLLILIGIPWRKYRFSYLVDIVVLQLIIMILPFREKLIMPFSCITVLYIILVLISYLRRRNLIIPVNDPGEGFHVFTKTGRFIPSVKKMNEEWFIKLFMERRTNDN